MLPQRLHEGIGNGALKGQKIDPDEFFAARRSQRSEFPELPEPAERERRGGRGQLRLDYSDTSSLSRLANS